jgi:hypothetical protein
VTLSSSTCSLRFRKNGQNSPRTGTWSWRLQSAGFRAARSLGEMQNERGVRGDHEICSPVWETDGGGRISKSTPAAVSSVTSRSSGGGFHLGPLRRRWRLGLRLVRIGEVQGSTFKGARQGGVVLGMDGRRRCLGRLRRPRPLAGWMGPAGPGGWAGVGWVGTTGSAQSGRIGFFSEIHFQYKRIPDKLQKFV